MINYKGLLDIIDIQNEALRYCSDQIRNIPAQIKLSEYVSKISAMVEEMADEV